MVMARYELDVPGMQMGLMQTATEAESLGETVKGFAGDDAKAPVGSHASAAAVMNAWESLTKKTGRGGERLVGAIQRKATAMRDAGSVIVAGDAGMQEKAQGSLSKITNGWGV